ncbi:phage tail protein [Methylobacterium sp. 092160098-2]|uniref:phage tail protein n=1 Tax=unclassified Methylobacterium TaxID=2615210 RepID=UPI002381ABEA|nr:phage tail protein [Methylobacterium sp. 092160098-2]MDE4909948.1 phage tail protein [Methylobacterium sp. 092160098-2]
MSLFGGKKRTVRPDYTGLQVQTASSALPIPIVYGTNRIAPNVIWSDGFQTHAQRGKKAGGKGGGRHGVTGYTYSTWIMFGLAEGPVQGIGEVFSGQSVTPFPTNFLSLIPGDTPQRPWGPALARYPAAALPYNGTAYLASPYFDLGSSATISSIAFEVVGRLAGTAGPLGQDADPAELISDFLTNAQYGVGLPASALSGAALFGASGDASYQTYCAALGLGLSPALTDAETANAILARWLRLTNSAAVWSGARLRIVPYGDQVVTGVTHSGASVTYVPDVAPVYDLTDDDVLAAEGDDPVRVARSDPYGLPNVQRVECSDRSHGYTATTVEARDQGAIERYGLKVGGTITAREICALSIGRLVAQLALQRALYIRNTYTFRLSWEFCLLEPMDVVTLTDPGLGLARTPVRITAIEEDEDGLLTITAEEFPRGTATAAPYPAVGATGSAVDRDRAPAPVNDPLIFEPPAALTAGVPQVWIAASGVNADPYWGGANVWVSRDGASFVEIGTITGPARQGVLAVDLAAPAGLNPDRANTLVVDLGRSGGTLASADEADARDGVTLALVGQELMSFANATLTAPHVYALTYLERGLSGSPAGAHPAGAPFTRLDEAVFRYSVPAAYIGTPLTVKLQAFNIFGGAAQDLATCTPYTVTPIGSGRFGPVAETLAVGSGPDLGFASQAATRSDDFGFASDPYPNFLDLGLASS